MSEYGDKIRDAHAQREHQLACDANARMGPSEMLRRIFTVKNPPIERARVSTAERRKIQRQAVANRDREILRKANGLMTSTELTLRLGVSNRQLQWWSERGIIKPRIDGHARVYTPQQVEEVRKLIMLRRAGVSLKQCRKLLKLQFSKVRSARKPFLMGDVLVVA
jgi:transposase-like protein